jgi:hypothetical protein
VENVPASGFVMVSSGLKDLSVPSQTRTIPPDKPVSGEWDKFAACYLVDSPWSQDNGCTAQV